MSLVYLTKENSFFKKRKMKRPGGVSIKDGIDWLLLASILPIIIVGLVTMYSFSGDSYYFENQIIWALLSLIVFFGLSFFNFQFLRNTRVLMTIFVLSALTLFSLFAVGNFVKGVQRWIDLGFFSIQPSDPVKLVVILILAKYFSRRHIEIANFRHIFVSGVYAVIISALVFLQPDFGSSIIIILIWFGMILASGVSKKHLLFLFVLAGITFSGLWFFALSDYQKQRVETFLHPFADLTGSGYNAYQSQVAIGSGQLLGKGIGYGTQSRLSFLPEYQSDFMFAAFSEEWGFIGVIMLFLLYFMVIFRILKNASLGVTNFEVYFGIGLAILIISHFIVHIGTNIGLLPVTGTTLPFMSYGGSHLLTTFIGLGILMGMRRYSRIVHREKIITDEVAASIG